MRSGFGNENDWKDATALAATQALNVGSCCRVAIARARYSRTVPGTCAFRSVMLIGSVWSGSPDHVFDLLVAADEPAIRDAAATFNAMASASMPCKSTWRRQGAWTA
jgi:hypothetical protein